MMLEGYSSLRKKPIPPYRQKFVWGVVPVPGSELRNPPVNHHGVDLVATRRKIELNRASIQEGELIYPGLGVSKHPMTIVTSDATYIVGWASRGGRRSISMVGGEQLHNGKILFLSMGEPMVFTGPGNKRLITPPVIFIDRRHYHEVAVCEIQFDVLAPDFGEGKAISNAA
jgi:hypothetical protein